MLHQFFYFLGTLNGIFFKNSLELILFFFVTYMISSEYTRDKRKELKYLIIAFGSLFLHRLITSLLFAGALFGDFKITALEPYVPLMNMLELFAFILLANAFVFPAFKKRQDKLASYVKKEIIALIAVFAVIEALWLIDMQLSPEAVFRFHWGSLIFIILRILVLSYPIYVLFGYQKKEPSEDYTNTITAFSVYLVVPVLQLINFVFFNDHNAKLSVIQHPFPLISVVLFARIIYLKLVDKALLKEQLKLSEQKYKEEREISEMKDEFISVVSHELRTPLTSMKLYTSLLKNEKLGKISPKQEKALTVIQEENNRLSSLIEDLLNLSKLEKEKEKLHLESFDFAEMSKNKMYYGMANQKGIKVVNNVQKKFIIKADVNKFKQIFVNLLSNAVKYTNKGGAITISAKNRKDCSEISIADTGIGIKKSEIPKLFSKFYQVEQYMTRKEGGTGLGLAIVKHLVDLHKGDVKVESEPGKGSTFTVCIPK